MCPLFPIVLVGFVVTVFVGRVSTCAIISASILHLFYGSRPMYYLEVNTSLVCLSGENKPTYYAFLHLPPIIIQRDTAKAAATLPGVWQN